MSDWVGSLWVGPTPSRHPTSHSLCSTFITFRLSLSCHPALFVVPNNRVVSGLASGMIYTRRWFLTILNIVSVNLGKDSVLLVDPSANIFNGKHYRFNAKTEYTTFDIINQVQHEETNQNYHVLFICLRCLCIVNIRVPNKRTILIYKLPLRASQDYYISE